jgi:hypothetical protein
MLRGIPPQRILWSSVAAATVLHSRGCRGRYFITHENGSLTISAAE